MHQNLHELDPSAAVCSEGREYGNRAISPGGVRWHFAGGWNGETLRVDELDWSRPGGLGAELIKENAQRQVWRMSLGGRQYYVKLYLKRRALEMAKCWVRGARCLKEWRVAQYALTRGVDCVRPVAYGICTGRGDGLDSLLITEGLPGAVPLTEYWRGLSTNGDRRRAAAVGQLEDALAKLLAEAHRAGIVHCDLHPGNLLVAESGDGPSVYLVDLHSVKTNKVVSDRVAIRTLAQLNQWFQQNATVTQRMRLLKRYMRYRSGSLSSCDGDWPTGAFKRLARSLDRAAGAHSRRLCASRDRRVMRTGKYFAKLKLPRHWRAHVLLKAKRRSGCPQVSQFEFTVDGWREVLREPEKVVDQLLSQFRPIKHSRSTLVCKGSLRIDDNEVAVVCKRHIRHKRLAAIWDCLRYSRPIRAWKMGFAMLHRLLPVAQPLAVLERRVGPYLLDSLLITEEVRPAVNLRMFLTTVLPVLDVELRRRVKAVLTDLLADLLRRMHRSGFVHRDMKATNILISGVGADSCEAVDPEALRLVLVDLDGLRLKRRASMADQLRALARLSMSADLSPHITLADRARFLRTYLACYGGGVPDWRLLWRKIEAERENRFSDHLAG